MIDSSRGSIKKNSFDALGKGQKLFYTLSFLQEHFINSSPKSLGKLFSKRTSLKHPELISGLQHFIIETALDRLISRNTEEVPTAITQKESLYNLSVDNVPSFLSDLSKVLESKTDEGMFIYSEDNKVNFSLNKVESPDIFAKNIRQFCKKANRAVSSFSVNDEEKKALRRKLVNYTLRVSTPATFAAALKATKKTAKGCKPDARREEVVSRLCAVLKDESYSVKDKSIFLKILSKNTWTYNSLPKQLKAEDWAMLLQAVDSDDGLCKQVRAALDLRLSWRASFFGAEKVKAFRAEIKGCIDGQNSIRSGIIPGVSSESDDEGSPSEETVQSIDVPQHLLDAERKAQPAATTAAVVKAFGGRAPNRCGNLSKSLLKG